jgi:hypothetical protein
VSGPFQIQVVFPSRNPDPFRIEPLKQKKLSNSRQTAGALMPGGCVCAGTCRIF